jgi:hypothetical protein
MRPSPSRMLMVVGATKVHTFGSFAPILDVRVDVRCYEISAMPVVRFSERFTRLLDQKSMLHVEIFPLRVGSVTSLSLQRCGGVTGNGACGPTCHATSKKRLRLAPSVRHVSAPAVQSRHSGAPPSQSARWETTSLGPLAAVVPFARASRGSDPI